MSLEVVVPRGNCPLGIGRVVVILVGSSPRVVVLMVVVPTGYLLQGSRPHESCPQGSFSTDEVFMTLWHYKRLVTPNNYVTSLQYLRISPKYLMNNYVLVLCIICGGPIQLERMTK